MAARKNYSFEKNQRARAKAAKREAKREQKLAKKREEDGGDDTPSEVTEGGEPSIASTDSTASEDDKTAGGAH